LVGWLGVATALYVSNNGMIEVKEAEIDTQQLTLERIVRDVSARQNQVAELTAKLKENQALLLASLNQQRNAPANAASSQAAEVALAQIDRDLVSMEEAGSGLEQMVAQAQGRLNEDFSGKGRIASARRELWNRLQEAQTQLKDESGRSESLKNDLYAFERPHGSCI
jgi:chromosome segregation ATPase